MLHPKNNRMDYGEQLIPPEGYELTFAVGTSYSLDLEALMILPVALFYAQNLDGKPDELRYDMLDAITKAADKISVYHQNGQLKMPVKYHHLMAYWEKGIQPVTMPSHVSSFHPKVWVMRYESPEGAAKYRVLITSRNLTFARDWDLAFSTDGVVTDKNQPKNKPLVHFLQYLNSQGTRKIPASFINDLLNVKFDIPAKFDSFKFAPIGIHNPETDSSYVNSITAPKTVWDELLIISPFVDKTTLDRLSKSTTKMPSLFSRKEELDSVPESTLELFDNWEFSNFFEKAEYFQELAEEAVEPLPQNLHAKLFVGMIDNTPYWHLGSANCSDPAQGRNVEFMVELKGLASSGLRTKDIYKSISDPSKLDGITLFTPYEFSTRVSVEEKKNIDLEIRKIKYDLSLLPIKGKAELIDGGTAYNLAIEIDATQFKLPKGFHIKIRPLPEELKEAVTLTPESVNHINEFNGYAETALSIFLVFEINFEGITPRQFLLPMEIELPESRLNKIFSSIIDSRAKFLKYIAFLLSGEDSELISDKTATKKKSSRNDSDLASFAGTPVYEKLLIAASRYPNKLKSIDSLVQRLKAESTEMEEPIISPEFESFWQVFQTFINNNNK